MTAMTIWSHLLTPQDDDADTDDDAAENVYRAGEIRPEFADKYLPINEPHL